MAITKSTIANSVALSKKDDLKISLNVIVLFTSTQISYRQHIC